MEEGIFPGMKAIGEPEEMEEERRLCYVAITRAMRQPHIVCARQRMIFGRTTANKVSRFVDEIPEEHIEKRNAQRPSHNAERRPEMQFASKSRYASARQYSMNAPAHRPAPPSAPSAQAKPAPDYSAGDRIVHQAFGAGTLTKMTPMGGDFLIEISFDSGKDEEAHAPRRRSAYEKSLSHAIEVFPAHAAGKAHFILNNDRYERQKELFGASRPVGGRRSSGARPSSS